MKTTLFYPLLFSLTLGITSCQDNDDTVDLPVSESFISGDWRLTDTDLFTLDFRIDNGNRVAHRVEQQMIDPGNYTLTFKRKSQETTSSGSATFKRIESSDRGGNSQSTVTTGDFLALGKWTVNRDRLTITTGNDQSTTYNIYALTDRKLVFGNNFEDGWKPVKVTAA